MRAYKAFGTDIPRRYGILQAWNVFKALDALSIGVLTLVCLCSTFSDQRHDYLENTSEFIQLLLLDPLRPINVA